MPSNALKYSIYIVIAKNDEIQSLQATKRVLCIYFFSIFYV